MPKEISAFALITQQGSLRERGSPLALVESHEIHAVTDQERALNQVPILREKPESLASEIFDSFALRPRAL